MSRPYCPECGKLAPKVLSYHYTREYRRTGVTREVLINGTNYSRVENAYAYFDTPYRGNLKILRRRLLSGGGTERLTLWDGVTYSFRWDRHPFCSPVCAIAFGRAVIAKGEKR